MRSYKTIKGQMDKIKHNSNYNCSGGVIFTTAMQYVIQYGIETFRDEDFCEEQIELIDKQHDEAEANGKHLFVGREFSKAIIGCAFDISCEFEAAEIMMYIQHEWCLFEQGDLPYDRAIELLDDTLSYLINDSIYAGNSELALEYAESIGFKQSEVEFLGHGYMYSMEDEE